MPTITWKFSISSMTGDSLSCNSIGVELADPSEVEEIAKVCGFETTGWDQKGKSYRKIEVNELQGSERLVNVLRVIKEKYGFVPSPQKGVVKADRDTTFGLRRLREYTKAELDECDYLYISHVAKPIGNYRRGTDEDIENEVYHVENQRKNKGTVLIGFLSPLAAIGVRDNLKAILEQANLLGLQFEPIVNSSDVWKPTSSIVLPLTSVPTTDGAGAIVDPLDWSVSWPEKYLNDDGCVPAELRYTRSEIALLEPFDVAITAERINGTDESAFRKLVVSQKFKQTLDNLKVKGIRYTPVRIEDV